MADHTTRFDETYVEPTDPAVWSPTTLLQLTTLNDDIKYLKDMTVHGVSASSVATADSDGFQIFQVTNTDDTSGPNDVTLILPSLFNNTNINDAGGSELDYDCRYRYVHIQGVVNFLEDAGNGMPGESGDNTMKWGEARWDGGSNYDVDGTVVHIDCYFYSGEGGATFDDGEYRIELVDGDESDGFTLDFWVDAGNGGRLKMYWNSVASRNPAYSFQITVGPRYTE